MKEYWNKRYAGRCNSGAGSSGLFRAFVHETLHGLRIPMEKSLLDYGCGDIQLWKNFRIEDYTGLDISNTIIRRNKKKFPHHKFIMQDDLTEMYDVSFCISVIFHILDKKELFRVLVDLATHTKETIVISYWEQEPPNVNPEYERYWAHSEWGFILVDLGWKFTSLHYSGDKYNVICVFEKRETE